MSRPALYLLFTASGFAGLIYESIWTQYLKLFLGHAAYAQSLVLVVFMGGMAAGAAWCARRAEKMANPLLAYAAVEALIGIAALAFHALFVWLTDWSYDSLLPALSHEWLVLFAKLALACLLILPPSILLGMTFPLMSGGLVRAEPRSAGESLAMLYFTNSLGAAAGALASGFILIAAYGLPGTLKLAGLLNLAIAIVVAFVARPLEHRPLAASGARPSGADLLIAVAFFTGLASFVYEISWIRMLSLVLGASTHAFELMLAAFVFGLALGGLAVRRRIDAAAEPVRWLAFVQIAMGLAALATLPVYDWTFSLMEALMKGIARTESGYRLFNAAGALIASIIMLPATFCAGMTLPLLTAALLRRGRGEAAIGNVYAANTLGAIAGVVLALHLGLPLVGLKGTLMAGALIDVALGLLLLRFLSVDLIPAALLCAVLFLSVGVGVELDANKMTAGVFRYGELSASNDATVLFKKDGKTATVHLVRYPEATSLRTNGKSDGSINMDPGGERGSDEITMVLTAALPLALKPQTRSAAVIGIGTGLTMHTLLQDLDLERVETIEIEPAMAEAARGFTPRNSGAFVDPRGSIVIDDAKSFFAAHRRRYDLIISEPSNPWVSGVSSLFSREFYRRIRPHLNPGGLLVQWIQLYEIDPALVATVLAALSETFPHYAIYAPSDHDILIVASEAAIPPAPQARVFEQPGLAKELWTVHVLSIGDLDARYVGNRATLGPLFASYAMPANSDYYPVLDLNAARQRFMEKSAAEIVALGALGVPVLELLEPTRPRRAPNPLYDGAYAFERLEKTRLAWYARNYLVEPRPPAPQGVPRQLQKDLELVKLRVLQCRAPKEEDVWLHSAMRVAEAMNPYLNREDLAPLWARMTTTPCFAGLHDFQQQWLQLFGAVAARDAARMAALASALLLTQSEAGSEAREYLLLAAMAGSIASGEREGALRAWRNEGSRVRGMTSAAFRLLRCHADPVDCAWALSAAAKR
ncbi:MAG TPA: fused MFS/spermidine synthase [Burkholderiales bacterium]